MAKSQAILAAEHRKRVEGYIASLKRMYAKATARFAALATSADYDGDGIFSFSDYKDLAKEADSIVKSLSLGIKNVVLRGTDSEWTKGSVVSNSTVDRVLDAIGMKRSALSGAADKMYFDNHDAALHAFQRRNIGKGETLSSRVWEIANQHKLENELAYSISRGTSADETAREIQKLLNEPDRLYRRVRDEYGELQLSKHAKQYSPGAGVYRSSYKNAMRLARTEINMAYRNSELESYQDKDYVVGYEIHRSTHDYSCDVCARLAGKYPKDFKWNGWHPNCRCFITPILLTEDEMAARREAILRGDEFDSSTSQNYVSDVPKDFNDWVSDNTGRIESAYTRGKVPYFLSDNSGYVGKSMFSELAQEKGVLSLGDIERLVTVSPRTITEELYMDSSHQYVDIRADLHRKIVKDYIGDASSKSDTVFMLGGAPANGKSTLVDSGMLKFPKGSLVIDADKVKSMIPEYASLVNSGDKKLIGLAANFVHEESSMLGKTIQKEAFGKGLSVVIDGVNDGSFEKVKKNVAKIKAMTGGKRIRADYVTLDTDLSLKLAEARAKKTGRLVPREVILKGNKGISEIIPKIVADGTFDELYLWDTNINGTPRLILKQIDGKLEIIDKKLYDAFLKKAEYKS